MDNDDRLLSEGKGMNENHEIKFRERVLNKSFLDRFYVDNTCSKRYHYTSPEGLMGILKTRTFYFTDSQFLNDFREKININDELKLFWKENQKNYDIKFVNLIKNIRVTQYEDNSFSYIDNHNETMCRYFVLSLSMNEDSLTMWKYYSKNGEYNGYCIEVFDYALTDEWIDRVTGVTVIASKVEYCSDEKQELILRSVDRLYKIWKSYEFSEMLDNKIIKEFTSWVSVEALFFKDECFQDEQETRYVAIVPTNKLNTLHYTYKEKEYKMYDFRIVNGVFTPFIRMPFNYWNEEVCLAISSIGIGPSANSEQKEAGLEQLIRSLDYKLDECKIYKSKIPVRY